jgi:hypothetical protein
MADATVLPDRDLGAALRALPLEAPDASAWPRIAAHIADRQRRPRTRRAAWLALAASIIAGLLVAGSGTWRSVPSEGATAQAEALPALMAESAQLERLLAAADDDSAGNASALVLSLQLEDRLRGVDAQLARPGLADARRLDLWRERVELLRVAAGLESSRRYYAAQGQAIAPTLVATY